jgi:hypothetical protein
LFTTGSDGALAGGGVRTIMFDLTNKLGVRRQESCFAQHTGLAAGNSVTAELIAFVARDKHYSL